MWKTLERCVQHISLMNTLAFHIDYPGSVLEKKLTGGGGGGSAYFFGSEIFDILTFWGLENLSYFFGSEDVSLIFWG